MLDRQWSLTSKSAPSEEERSRRRRCSK